jgi:hypothetical protein
MKSRTYTNGAFLYLILIYAFVIALVYFLSFGV